MRITKQPSGERGEQGRGEYELADFALDGVGPSDLLERTIHLQIGQRTLNTDVRLTKDQGKYRLRVNSEPRRYRMIPNQLAVVLLMPPPARSEANMATGEPVLQNESYVIKNVWLCNVEVDALTTCFAAEVTALSCGNRTVQEEEIDAARRMSQVERVWAARDEFPQPLADLIAQHEKLVGTGGPIGTDGRSLVQKLQEELERWSSELDISYAHSTDPLPALRAVTGDEEEQNALPIPLDQIEIDQIDLRRREIIKWQEWVRKRGALSRRFSREVRAAYNARCVMCGGRFPVTSVNSKPGVDAAHILPWADYDLDEVYNGLALCKLHHWAFDEHLLLIRPVGGRYIIDLASGAESELRLHAASVDLLRQVIGPITPSRLPTDQRHWPAPALLERWNDEPAFTKR